MFFPEILLFLVNVLQFFLPFRVKAISGSAALANSDCLKIALIIDITFLILRG